jgi:heme-degrading monooxygenase HmoA
MIARTWRGRTKAGDRDSYVEYLERTGCPDLRGTPGNQGVFVLRRIEGDVAEFLLVSLWESFEAIERFAGPDPEVARYYPDDPRYLLELEPRVTHFEVVAAPAAR